VDEDVLGAPYERMTIDLGEDDEGAVVATLVRRRCEAPTTRAVLYIHGYTDYFFQTHLADFFVDAGIDFYAIDLRKHGRSLAAHQTANFTRDVASYFTELDEALRIIREVDGHTRVLVSGHSTGALTASLWAHRRRTDGVIDGLFLNSPFFEFNVSAAVRGRSARRSRRSPAHGRMRCFRPASTRCTAEACTPTTRVSGPTIWPGNHLAASPFGLVGSRPSARRRRGSTGVWTSRSRC
jgi:alpha-beta hydrolase superfamily lysophospholipase